MKILIELPTWLGDTVMVTPAIENLISNYSEPDITLIGTKPSIELLKNLKHVNKTQHIEKSYLSIYKISKKLGEFDIFFSFRESFRSKYLKYQVSSKNKFQFKRSLYENLHQVEKYNQFINDSLKTNFKPGKLIINSGLENNTRSKPILGINPGASYGSAKMWYPKEFAMVAEKLSNKYDIFIFGSNKEQEIANEIEKLLIQKKVSNVKNYAGKTSISELISYISQTHLFITGDTGSMHLAATFQIPSVTIFGPTNENETSQWMNKKSIIVKKDLSCQPCMQRVCPLKHHNCMKLIKADEVFDAVKSLKL
jgi:heptosyltransferase II